MKTRVLSLLAIAASIGAVAQVHAQAAQTAPSPYFTMPQVSRTVEAINYRHRSGASKIDFAGTTLLPSANGVATVKSERGAISIEAEFSNLDRPTAFGTEYLTYILWAISPEGSAVNLGEVLVGGNQRSKLHVTTDLQAFALIVTAEPYYAVHQPSNVVVLENVMRSNTKGTSEDVHAKYELMERGGYIPTGYKFDPVVLDARLPLEFLEARNAVRIAQSEGAEQYATESYRHASQLMDTADRFATEKHGSRKQLIDTSREAVQTAEDARTIARKNMDQARNASERQDSADAQARSQAEADRANRDTDRANRQKEQAQADALAAQAAAARAQSDTAQAQSDAAHANANAAAASANADSANADARKAQSDNAANQANAAANQASSAAQLNAAQADADQSRAAADLARQHERQSDTDKANLRVQLTARLNEILDTRDSARGLVVNMSDVLFDTGKYSLRTGAREKLSKVAGILLVYPDLAIQVGGYTDNVGGDGMNQTLSENRAGTVRDYLVSQGVASASVSARGYGNSSPVASNDDSAGRQTNRRVELVVSGAAIGAPVTVTTAPVN